MFSYHHHRQVWLVTGDNAGTASAVASLVGIDPAHVLAQASPSDKAALVQRLQDEAVLPDPPSSFLTRCLGRIAACALACLPGTDSSSSSSSSNPSGPSGRTPIVTFVGDGVNDAIALARADIGVAVAAGTDVALETAGVVLMRDDLTDLITALDLSRRTLARIRANLVFALVYNVVCIPVAAGCTFPILRVSLPPMLAGLAMALSSVSVVCSSLLLRRYERPNLPDFIAHHQLKRAAADDQDAASSASDSDGGSAHSLADSLQRDVRLAISAIRAATPNASTSAAGAASYSVVDAGAAAADSAVDGDRDDDDEDVDIIEMTSTLPARLARDEATSEASGSGSGSGEVGQPVQQPASTGLMQLLDRARGLGRKKDGQMYSALERQ